MSKKPQVLKDDSGENVGINSAEYSPVNFIYQYKLFKTRDFKIGLEQLNLALEELSEILKNQIYIQALPKNSKFKNTNNMTRSLSSNSGPLFVFIVYCVFNTPILSL